jgi:CheY-like chemotaxis protein
MNRDKSRKPLVAVVDDEPDFIALVEHWLGADYRVASFTTTKEAREALPGLQPDLVLLDIHMPEGSGFALCRALREDPRTTWSPIVFLTGSRSDEDFLLHMESGGTRYLNKPISRERLLHSVADCLGAARSA